MFHHTSRRAARMATLAAAACFGLGFSPLFAHAEPKKTPKPVEVVPGEFVVELNPSVVREAGGVSLMAIESLSRKLGAEVVEQVRPEMVLVRASDQSAVGSRSLELRLQENAFVRHVEPNYIYTTSKLPNDPDLAKTWGLKNTGAADSENNMGRAGVDVSAEQAWDITTGSKSVVVAVIDSGIDFSHPDLKAQAWVNEKELNGLPGVDDDGNGYIDDIHGYDFAGNKGDSTDDNSHGTHCAGTIGAKGNDGRGLVGVNWDVSMMGVKFLDKQGRGSLANAIKSIDYARKMGARIMSNSWGGGAASDLLKKAIQEAANEGVLFVAAAGNDANDNDAMPSYPASYDVDNVLSVAAIDNRGALASFSNYGAKSVHVAAPGVNIISTVPGGKYDSYSGTSMATPHVSGIAALLLANNANLTYSQLKKTIMDSSRPLYTLRRRVASAGMADAYYALSGQTPPADPNDPSRLKNVSAYAFSSEHPYKEGAKFEHKIRVPGAKKIAVRFSKFETEIGYDTLSFYDSKGAFVGSLSGTQDPGVTSQLIEGDSVTLKFSADETVSGYGFDIDGILWE